jgi:hypothetical protein
MSSLLEKWHPVTSDFGLIRAPLQRVVSDYESWRGSDGTKHLRTEIASSLSDALESLLPLAMSKMRRLFIPTRSDWVVFLQNGIAGSDPFFPMMNLARRMGVLAMRVCCTVERARYPGTIWEVYAPESLGGCPPLGDRRSIAAMNDGGRWIFSETGERYPFEQIERYSAWRKRNRFTREMLRDYLRHFGIELFADEFLHVDAGSPAVRLQQVTNVWHAPEYTLEQVVAGVPWQRAR